MRGTVIVVAAEIVALADFVAHDLKVLILPSEMATKRGGVRVLCSDRMGCESDDESDGEEICCSEGEDVEQQEQNDLEVARCAAPFVMMKMTEERKTERKNFSYVLLDLNLKN